MCEGFWLENRNEKDCLEDQDVAGKMTTNSFYRDAVEGRGVDCIHLAQYRDKWQALVNKVTNFLVEYSAGIFRLAMELTESHKRLCSEESVSWLVSQLL
jgi:hypothetical protein